MVTHHWSLFGAPDGNYRRCVVAVWQRPRGRPPGQFHLRRRERTVLVRHFGGDTFDGSDGTACTASVTRVSRRSVCRAFDAAYERLYVVREGPDDRR